MAITFAPRVGRVKISKTLDPSTAAYTRLVRAQMKQIGDNYSAMISQLKGVTPSVLEDALLPTFKKAIKYTPVDTGALRESGYLETSREGRNVRAEVGFGKGGEPTYAAIVHERTDLNHKAPTRAKFLQTALEEDFGVILKRIQKAYRDKLKLK